MYRHSKKHDSGLLGDRLETSWYKEKSKTLDPSFFKIFLKIFGIEVILLYTFAFAIDVVR